VLLYVLYWYKSTNTDATRAGRRVKEPHARARYEVYLLYWYKSANLLTPEELHSKKAVFSPALLVQKYKY
jgi:hypothetical protein